MIKRHIQYIRFAIILIMVLVISALIFSIFAPYVLQRAIDKSREKGDMYRATEQSLRLVSLFPTTEIARQTLLQLLSHIEHQESRIVVGPNSIMYNHAQLDTVPKEYTQKILQEAYRVAQAQKESLWAYTIHERIGDFTYALGDVANAVKEYTYALEQFEKRGMSFRVQQIIITLFDIHIAQKDYDQARSLLETYVTNDNTSLLQKAQITARKGVLALEMGSYEEAEKLFLLAQEETKLGIAQLPKEQFDRPYAVSPQEQEGYIVATQGLQRLQELLSADQGTSIEGTIIALGEPMEDVLLFLVPISESRVIVSHSEALKRYQHTTTNAEGYYRFTNFAPGHYYYMLAFHPTQLKGLGAFSLSEEIEIASGESQRIDISLQQRILITNPLGFVSLPYGESVELQWEAVSEAFEYGIHVIYFTGPEHAPYQSSAGRELFRVTQPSITLDTNSLEARSPLGVFSEERLHLASIIGPFHPGSYVTLKVIAYDQNNKRITDSEGLLFDRGANYPLWHITDAKEEHMLLAGDLSLLSGDIEQALALYAQEMQEGSLAAHMAYEALQRYLSFSSQEPVYEL